MSPFTLPEYADRLTPHGLTNIGTVYWNAPTSVLYEQAIQRGEGWLAHDGPLIVHTGKYTGRSPEDRFVVEDDISRDTVRWGKINVPFPEERFERLLNRMYAYTQRLDLFVLDCHVNADPDYRKPIRIITENAWHNLFARNMFRDHHPPGEMHGGEPHFTVLHMPGFQTNPWIDHTNSEAAIIISFKMKLVLIAGSRYGGEIKKSIFSVMNHFLPDEDVLPMHCSANIGADGDSALFFGLSGTGKTTLSADPHRALIGDDEHGWSKNGVFNMEGGCYAKVIDLSPEAEPEIFATTKRFGTILENVVFDADTRRIDLADRSLTENTRASYPLTSIPNIKPDSVGPHPNNIMFLTADAFGVLPPISRLTREQAMYHFISGYTSKLAGTERGVTEPKAAFSALFGAPFMPRSPAVYAEMLGERVDEHNSTVWLVNTGWTGGPYGAGHRIAIKHTRAMVNAAIRGELDDVDFEREPVFGLAIPERVPGVPEDVLRPRDTWTDKQAYDKKAEELAAMFHRNIEQYAEKTPAEILDAGPIAGN
ncbi:MAG: Phosphoenolpyruvate carboxykinase (ATP) [Calditrichaeota bacterium]|nr:Phosphoenolpyruvate carboxykinase (ATP) [Calditrichota bacterium]